MEGRKIIIGDHTGLIKVLSPDLSILGKAGPQKSVINLIQRENLLLAVRSHGSVDQFTLESPTFSQIRPGSEKITDGVDIDGNLLIAYPNGSFDFSSNIFHTSLSECSGISSSNSFSAFCGTSNSEIWDMASTKLLFKSWTAKPQEQVNDTKCFLKDNLLYTTSFKNEVKMFDIRAGKKPRKTLQLNPEGHIYHYPLSAISVTEDLVFLGDVVGNIYKVSKDFKVLGKTKGRSVGAVQSICVDGDEVYSCGLDRRLMIHNVRDLMVKFKHFLWQKLNKVLVLRD